MSATSNDISSNCSQAAQSSNRASDTARGGAQVVQQPLVGMQKIAERVKVSAQTVQNLGTRSGEALDDIMNAINELTSHIHQIATAAEQQTAVIGEITSNIGTITDVVSETAGGAHETAKAGTHMSGPRRGAATDRGAVQTGIAVDDPTVPTHRGAPRA